VIRRGARCRFPFVIQVTAGDAGDTAVEHVMG